MTERCRCDRHRSSTCSWSALVGQPPILRPPKCTTVPSPRVSVENDPEPKVFAPSAGASKTNESDGVDLEPFHADAFTPGWLLLPRGCFTTRSPLDLVAPGLPGFW